MNDGFWLGDHQRRLPVLSELPQQHPEQAIRGSELRTRYGHGEHSELLSHLARRAPSRMLLCIASVMTRWQADLLLEGHGHVLIVFKPCPRSDDCKWQIGFYKEPLDAINP